MLPIHLILAAIAVAIVAAAHVALRGASFWMVLPPAVAIVLAGAAMDGIVGRPPPILFALGIAATAAVFLGAVTPRRVGRSVEDVTTPSPGARI